MALRLRNLLKCVHLSTENMKYFTRSIAVSNVRHNTTNEKKEAEAQTEDDKAPSNTEIETIKKKVEELTEKNLELTDKYKRALADGENMRQRLTKQIADAKIFGVQTFCKDLLDVADVLSKATETVPKEEISDKNPHLKSLYEGLILTEAQLKNVFKRYGLEAVNPLNEKFDPNYHEALFQQEVKNKEPGVVVVVSKIGYKLHDRVLRPALVGVSK